jgi:hypothetical protein
MEEYSDDFCSPSSIDPSQSRIPEEIKDELTQSIPESIIKSAMGSAIKTLTKELTPSQIPEVDEEASLTADIQAQINKIKRNFKTQGIQLRKAEFIGKNKLQFKVNEFSRILRSSIRKLFGKLIIIKSNLREPSAIASNQPYLKSALPI